MAQDGQRKSIKKAVKRHALICVVTALAVLALFFYWKTVLLVLRGLVYAAIALAVIFVGILLWIKLRYRQPSHRKLFSEKKKMLGAIKIAEKRYMRRKLSEKDFNKIFKEKQRRLIEVEAKIDQLHNEEKGGKVDKQVLAVQTKKRHILKSLLEEKRRVIKEMDIAEKRYLKRKIDAKTYQDLVQKNQNKLIELEANIEALYSEANVSKVMLNLKNKLSELEKSKKKRGEKEAKSEREEQLQIAKQIADQISRK